MFPQRIVLTVPTVRLSLTGLAKQLGFEQAPASRFEGESPCFLQDRTIWLCSKAKGRVCLHSLYRDAANGQGGLIDLIGAHTLYCLAVHLKGSPAPELAHFSGLVHAFGASKLGNRTWLNNGGGFAGDMPDLLTPVLYIQRGVPRSIYTMWHSDDAEGPTYIAYGGDADLFDAEKERNRSVAA